MEMPFFSTPKSIEHAKIMWQLSGMDSPAMETTTFPALHQAQLSSMMANTALSPHSSHPALPRLTMLVFEAVLEVVCVSLPGYIVARQGMFDAEMQKFAANLNVAIFTPCLSKSRVSPVGCITK